MTTTKTTITIISKVRSVWSVSCLAQIFEVQEGMVMLRTIGLWQDESFFAPAENVFHKDSEIEIFLTKLDDSWRH